MTQYIVTFGVSTGLVSLGELSSVLGETPLGADLESHGYVEWQIESSAGKSASLEEHFESLVALLPVEKLEDPALPRDREMRLEIVATYDTACCTVRVPLKWLEWSTQHKARLEVVCYPVSLPE